jgi:hypothetical protein
MRMLIVAGAFLMLPLLTALTGIDSSKTAPTVPPQGVYWHGDGGGP